MLVGLNITPGLTAVHGTKSNGRVERRVTLVLEGGQGRISGVTETHVCHIHNIRIRHPRTCSARVSKTVEKCVASQEEA